MERIERALEQAFEHAFEHNEDLEVAKLPLDIRHWPPLTNKMRNAIICEVQVVCLKYWRKHVENVSVSPCNCGKNCGHPDERMVVDCTEAFCDQLLQAVVGAQVMGHTVVDFKYSKNHTIAQSSGRRIFAAIFLPIIYEYLSGTTIRQLFVWTPGTHILFHRDQREQVRTVFDAWYICGQSRRLQTESWLCVLPFEVLMCIFQYVCSPPFHTFHRCIVCDNITHSRCSLCKHVYFCSQKCQRSGWKEHQGLCTAYTEETATRGGLGLLALTRIMNDLVPDLVDPKLLACARLVEPKKDADSTSKKRKID